MQRPWLKSTVATLVVVALFAGVTARAAETPFVGNWKLTDLTTGNEVTYVLFQVEAKDGKLQAKVLAAPLLKPAVSIENFKADGKSMQMDVKFGGGSGTLAVKGYLKSDAKSKAVLGSLIFGNQVMIARFTKTDDTDLKRADAVTQTDEGKQFLKARATRDVKEQQTALKELLEKNSDKPLAYAANDLLLKSYVKEPPADADVGKVAEHYLKAGAPYGPEVEHRALATASKTLAGGDKVSAGAIEFLRHAEKTLLKDVSDAQSVVVLKSLRTALRKTGQEKEAAELDPRIAKIDRRLDAEFEQTAVPFKPGEFKGRKGASKRVVVVELFTGAYCPPCVAADVAFDAALETFKPKDVILLQYHTHIPRPDRLVNLDTEARLKYYEDKVEGVPTAFLNGKTVQHEVDFMGRKVMAGLGGSKSGGQASYNILREKIGEALETDTETALTVNVERKGDKLDINSEVTSLKKGAGNVKLRFVLIEDVVHYPGGNGQRLHQHVVRALPGGADGFEVKGANTKQKASINLADLKKSLDEYMTDFTLKNKDKESYKQYQDDEHPLNIKNLKVVALLQDDDSKEILGAVQIDVPDAK